MTPRERQIRYRKYMRQQAKFENEWQPKVMYALRVQSAPFIARLMEVGPESALGAIDDLIQPEPIQDVLFRLYNNVGVRTANEEYGFIKRTWLTSQKAFGFNSFWRQIISNIFGRIGGEKVTSITETEKKRIRQVLEENGGRGLTNSQLAEKLRSDAVNEARSWVITRTEVGTASEIGKETAADQSGLQFRMTWISAQRNTTRRLPQDQFDHYHMQGVSIMPGEKFLVMGKRGAEFLKYPHDPEGSVGNLINCLCTVIREPI